MITSLFLSLSFSLSLSLFSSLFCSVSTVSFLFLFSSSFFFIYFFYMLINKTEYILFLSPRTCLIWMLSSLRKKFVGEWRSSNTIYIHVVFIKQDSLSIAVSIPLFPSSYVLFPCSHTFFFNTMLGYLQSSFHQILQLISMFV